ncbi:MAG: RdgB/HAM1 family non-canonical purine NTP pyrophosphatase [Lentimicrobiaceae bacterium]|jgi:XTP/dITP diphosphohydrolase|nr:RdgB/HAM1 family non-canonical purine NTP pyrophosphatase [Lentimicrobiaceae bacterium]
MIEIVFATNNIHKLEEVRYLFKDKFKILSLSDIGFYNDIPETADTLVGNAMQKVQHVIDRFLVNCFADDTGLEVRALNGAPGVFSARYAGESCSYEANVTKLLDTMKNIDDRRAVFKTIIVLMFDGQLHIFTGKIEGEITREPRGTAGFGYDSIFQPNGYTETFAEMDPALKNTISHRAIAVQKLFKFLSL